MKRGVRNACFHESFFLVPGTGYIFECFCAIAGGWRTRTMMRPNRATGEVPVLEQKDVLEIVDKEKTTFLGWIILTLGNRMPKCMAQTKGSLARYTQERGLSDRGVRVLGKLGMVERISTWKSRKKSLIQEARDSLR